MIGKGKSIAHTQASMAYGMKQGKQSEIVFKQYLAGETPQEIAEEFRLVQHQNDRCAKNTLSFVLSPTIEDGKNLQAKQLQEIVKRFIDEMKLQERQAIAFVHRNREHTHIHLYVNRIDFTGQAYKDNYVGKRSQQAAEKVAKEMGLTTVKEIQQERLIELQKVRAEIKRIHDRVVMESRPKSFEQYIEKMHKHQIEVKPYINKQGQLQGLRFSYQGQELKGSAVHRSLSMGNIAQGLSWDRAAAQKVAVEKSITLAGKTLPLAPNLAVSIAKKVLKLSIKQVRGIGIEI
ncbi:relaxase/mobilization nuclease domain-containing protein [Robiginitalea sediminis]|uniref:relaxase/mobilization nuclease domain-containing protein n=1 Tax=Robiginitalea sediminis TaxID=1982593 RepID=UPI000B4B0D6F|nr:relaxase/mobilization nuclease domain-containing protein [Robiginitalea sediminis]